MGARKGGEISGERASPDIRQFSPSCICVYVELQKLQSMQSFIAVVKLENSMNFNWENVPTQLSGLDRRRTRLPNELNLMIKSSEQ